MLKSILFLFISVLLACVNCVAQDGEYDNFDCTYSKEIVIPFNRNSSGDTINMPILNQTTFYSYNDQFSFYYKIVVQQDANFSFSCEKINANDQYELLVYDYKQKDFCLKLKNGKIEPLIGKGIDTYSKTERRFNVKAGSIYYVCVLNTSIGNCGHNFKLAYGNDTLKVKAIHLPCERKLLALKPSAIGPIQAKENETVAPSQKEDILVETTPTIEEPKPGSYKIKIVDDLTEEVLKVKLKVIDPITNQPIKAQLNADRTFTVTPGNQSYAINVFGLGIKPVNKNADLISESMNKVYTIRVKKIKKGEKIIMRKIYFFPNTYALQQESEDELKQLLEYLQNNPEVAIQINGHTNGNNRIRKKNPAYAGMSEEWQFEGSSHKLSKMRADAIKKYLILNDIPSNRIKTDGFGGDEMILKNPRTMEEGQKNMRVEVLVL